MRKAADGSNKFTEGKRGILKKCAAEEGALSKSVSNEAAERAILKPKSVKFVTAAASETIRELIEEAYTELWEEEGLEHLPLHVCFARIRERLTKSFPNHTQAANKFVDK